MSVEDQAKASATSEGAPPHLLTQLSAWHAFGERALLKNETRYATVRVTSDEMRVMSIGRDVFEAALGVRLSGALTREDSTSTLIDPRKAFAVTPVKSKRSPGGAKKSSGGGSSLGYR